MARQPCVRCQETFTHSILHRTEPKASDPESVSLCTITCDDIQPERVELASSMEWPASPVEATKIMRCYSNSLKISTEPFSPPDEVEGAQPIEWFLI